MTWVHLYLYILYCKHWAYYLAVANANPTVTNCTNQNESKQIPTFGLGSRLATQRLTYQVYTCTVIHLRNNIFFGAEKEQRNNLIFIRESKYLFFNDK